MKHTSACPITLIGPARFRLSVRLARGAERRKSLLDALPQLANTGLASFVLVTGNLVGEVGADGRADAAQAFKLLAGVHAVTGSPVHSVHRGASSFRVTYSLNSTFVSIGRAGPPRRFRHLADTHRVAQPIHKTLVEERVAR